MTYFFFYYFERVNNCLFLKLQPVILSLCLLLYMAELVVLPASMGKTAPKSTCCAAKMNKKATSSCTHQPPPCKKPQKSCNTDNCCANCPLCYAVTMPVAD